MPDWKTHLIAGAIASNLTSLFLISEGPFTLESALVYSVMFFIGSLFPDVDSNSSIIRRVLVGACLLSTVGVGILAKLTDVPGPYLMAVGFVITIALESVLMFLNHRGRLHHPVYEMLLTLVFVFITGFFLENYSFALKIFLGFYLGTLLHIVMDFR